MVGRHSYRRIERFKEFEGVEGYRQTVSRLLCSASTGKSEKIVRPEKQMFARCAGTRLERLMVEYYVLQVESDLRIEGECCPGGSRRFKDGQRRGD